MIVRSPLTGTVWKVRVAVGDRVSEDQELVILESMKMEIPVLAEEVGVVVSVSCREGDPVVEEQNLLDVGPI